MLNHQFETKLENGIAFLTGPALKAFDLVKQDAEKNGVAQYVFTNKDADFCGGTLEQLGQDLSQGKDLTKHLEMLSEFKRSNLGQKIEAIRESFAVRRRLRTSDIDGDWDYSRRFSDKPFVVSKKERVSRKAIDLIIRLNARGDVSSESLDRFGVLCWTVINCLESSGRRVRLRLISQASHSFKTKGIHSCVLLNVKEANEYLEPSRLAAVISANFFRRVIFGLRAFSGENLKIGAHKGMGSSYERPALEYHDDGALIISPDVIKGHDKALENELVKLLS